MNKQTEEIKLAIDYLEEIHVGNMTPMAEINWNKAIQACKKALAEADKQEWQSLTGREIDDVFNLKHPTYKEFARAIEQALKEKNT